MILCVWCDKLSHGLYGDDDGNHNDEFMMMEMMVARWCGRMTVMGMMTTATIAVMTALHLSRSSLAERPNLL
jgi:hypothetical protein